MSIQAAQIKALADELLQEANSEVVVRCAIGRLYYSCFHFASEIYKFLPIPTDRSKGSHQQLSNALIDATVASDIGITREIKKSINRVGYLLVDLKERRNAADYDLHVDIKMSDAAYVKERVDVLLDEYSIILSALNQQSEQA
jgi:uncharacterized protein (UPF0332 family)